MSNVSNAATSNAATSLTPSREEFVNVLLELARHDRAKFIELRDFGWSIIATQRGDGPGAGAVHRRAYLAKEFGIKSRAERRAHERRAASETLDRTIQSRPKARRQKRAA